MRSFVTAFFIGILLAASQSWLVAIHYYVLSIILLVVLLIFCQKKWQYWLLVILLGACWFLLHAAMLSRFRLPSFLIKQTVLIEGQIVSLPNHHLHSINFIFQVRRLQYHHHHYKLNTRVRLAWYYHFPQSLYTGQIWRLNVKLKPNHGFANPGGFDYVRWLFSKGIRATGYVKQGTLVKATTPNLRQLLSEHLTQLLHNDNKSNVIRALILGQQQQLTTQQWRVLQQTGTPHLVAISGLHIGLVMGFSYGFFQWILRFFWPCFRWWPRQNMALIGGLLIALLYSLLAGFALPTERAIIMLSCYTLTRLRKRYMPSFHIFIVGLGLVLFFQPLSILSASFWLSFGAVGLLIYGFWGYQQQPWRRAQWLIAIGLMPLLLFLFQRVSLIAPLANAIAIPLTGYLIVPLCLLGSLFAFFYQSMATILFHMANELLSLLFFVLTFLSHLPYATWVHVITSLPILICLLFFMLLSLLPSVFPGQKIFLLMLLSLLLIKPAKPHYGNIFFNVLDVGQGLSAVIETAHHVLVYDTGPRYSQRFDSGRAVLIPFLYSQGINQVDRLVISHGDNDHIGGAFSLLNTLPVLAINSSVPQRLSPFRASYCRAHQHWQWDGVTFRYLYPTSHHYGLGNNSSCVLKVSTGHASILLTGDIEKPAEEILLKHAAAELPTTIIVVPHHGSKTSSSRPFVKATHPQYAFFPTGYLNRFHFPDSKVVARYRAIGAKIFDTSSCGNIAAKIAHNGNIHVQCYRTKQSEKIWDH